MEHSKAKPGLPVIYNGVVYWIQTVMKIRKNESIEPEVVTIDLKRIFPKEEFSSLTSINVSLVDPWDGTIK